MTMGKLTKAEAAELKRLHTTVVDEMGRVFRARRQVTTIAALENLGAAERAFADYVDGLTETK